MKLTEETNNANLVANEARSNKGRLKYFIQKKKEKNNTVGPVKI